MHFTVETQCSVVQGYLSPYNYSGSKHVNQADVLTTKHPRSGAAHSGPL